MYCYGRILPCAKGVIEQIRVAYEKRGIIILTDPDTAGERIRRVLTKKFPNAQHAFVPRDEAYANDDIGIEQASPESIIKALSVLHTESLVSSEEFTMADLVRHGLSGFPNSADKRAAVGAALGIGYGNGKQFYIDSIIMASVVMNMNKPFQDVNILSTNIVLNS